ncbi:MAG: hypothetical protein F6K32_21270 [Desertifilum sp. SIO1I2]|nr:hypothetical protein [Desertifilum sp. SIO1I2]
MPDLGYAIFIVFGCIWILIGVAAVIALLKSDNQKIQFGEAGLIVAVPIIVPLILALAYQLVRLLA